MGHITTVSIVAIVYDPSWSREYCWIAVSATNPAEMITEHRWRSPDEAKDWLMTNSPSTEWLEIYAGKWMWNLDAEDYLPLGYKQIFQ